MSDRQRHGFVLLIVVGLIAASVAAIATQRTVLGLDLKGGVQLTYQASPTTQTPKVTQAALSRAVDIMRERVDQLGVSDPEIQIQGSNQIVVGLPDVHNVARAEQEVGTTAQLFFFDWEANVLTSKGQPAAAGLSAQDTASETLSQGASGSGPGYPGGGSMTLYQAVKLASMRPYVPVGKQNLARPGDLYFLFGAPGSSACATIARINHTTPLQGDHCLLAGPEISENLLSGDLQGGITMSDGQVLTVPQGTLVLQAAAVSPKSKLAAWSPKAQYYVLNDNYALTGSDITNPAESTDSNTSSPDVTFGFTGHGQSAFSRVTEQIAHRGALDSPPGQTLVQHFAVALDTQLVTVPYIDYKSDPDGITGGGGADITGGFTAQSAADLANQLRLGALPISLKRISESQVSATLGSQALHQGLIAGLAGLAVVAIFLISFYRVLGLIATSTLIVYALYFYALIKLIPITLTLPGIAGLILTIGVAADANIVIFERVKEEIRAGRSIRAGIATGYKKGLTAIIDANVVTIMTAFILFVLATAQVQGFAFTLGIGTIVSLFTAVLATQAILMTTADSRTIARPSALGAGAKKRRWRFDFMGASKYFFSLSGVILLIGALAIGGKGLNLGIDFTSGTRITAALDRPASVSQVSAAAAAAGAGSPQVQKVSDKGLGAHVYEITSKHLGPNGVPKVRAALQTRFGFAHDPDIESVGPTFGKTIANSAIVAIIASLLIISAYVALRFEWKFAVPVLIALMHDLLITAGVYALLGREVTVDTVAALLTILGYSLYDTIIVFDRVRENIPRMPRAAFSQIVNRSMSEVLTRSLATTSCTLLPIVALLLFGGSTLRDFAFALLVGVASGAYSSIFIASPVLTHWKEREATYRHRRSRILADRGFVAPYAEAGADIEPARGAPSRLRRPGRLTDDDPSSVSAAEFEQMKRDLEIENDEPSRRTSTLTKRLAHSEETEAETETRAPAPARRPRRAAPAEQPPAAEPAPPAAPASPSAGDGADVADGHQHAPDEAENEGMVPSTPKPKGAGRSRNRRHGRRR
jgi:SecD/SecF fusion protein